MKNLIEATLLIIGVMIVFITSIAGGGFILSSLLGIPFVDGAVYSFLAYITIVMGVIAEISIEENKDIQKKLNNYK